MFLSTIFNQEMLCFLKSFHAYEVTVKDILFYQPTFQMTLSVYINLSKKKTSNNWAFTTFFEALLCDKFGLRTEGLNHFKSLLPFLYPLILAWNRLKIIQPPAKFCLQFSKGLLWKPATRIVTYFDWGRRVNSF